ncbi:hypothetical protein BJ741DRAFT_134451 [Chytriomyces cf. hyalinus JEL632]|nr:hypothetical protein BJ741DRAFT_134451 [Chytriomyces cf. hyalinus JEL632]
MDELVSPCVAKQRFDHHNEYFPGSAELECVRRNNILVSRVIRNASVGWNHLCCATQDRFFTSTHRLKSTCDACSFRFPSEASVYLPLEKQWFPPLHQFLVQVNNNTNTTTNNITINNYNGANMQLDVQFNAIEPIFPDPDLNLVMFRSFNGHSGDIAYVVVYHVGRNVFGVVSKKDATEWWAWDSRVGR